MNKLSKTFIVIMCITLIASLCSCSSTGYGCHGRSKIITRVR